MGDKLTDYVVENWSTIKQSIPIMSNEEKERISKPARKHRKTFILNSITRGTVLFKKLTEQDRADKDIVLMAVRINGLDLEFASEELKSDNEVVLEAMKQNGNAFRQL